MNTFHKTEIFNDWLTNLRDIKARARIAARIVLAEEGNFGDCESVGEGISEMRLYFGPGYRLYFWRREGTTYWLLAGGDKRSQRRDIERAKKLRRMIEETPDEDE
ncbi:MAG: type II toxin-antitoxin system RelE/ParE family toxin [Desulfovibrio sp.]|jgi:putative addiction module killer protein|nr:type II toxin-antitoxin system RelE/ParE family toxin [Desulfovibrio sp.]